MALNRYSKRLVAASGLAVVAWLVNGAAQAATPAPFEMTSTTFKDGTLMPAKVANMNPPGTARPIANCVGQNVSPQLSWSGAPAGTKSFMLTVFDPEGRLGTGEYHLIAYGIPADVTSFAEGEVAKDSEKFHGGKSKQGVGQGVARYSGPCTPPGPAHHYIFELVATDIDRKELTPGLDLSELQEKLQGHAKGAAVLVGLYQHP